MSLRIAFDCDGCVADLESALAEISARIFGAETRPDSQPDSRNRVVATSTPDGALAGSEGPAPTAVENGELTADEVQAAPARFRALTRRQQHDLWEAVGHTENFWETLKETEPGIVARLAQAAKQGRWEVIFITQRPASSGDTTQLQTQRWLVAHGYEIPSVYVIKGSRGKIADALSLDVVVDDRPENCLDVKLESRARAILIGNGDPASIPLNARKLGIEPVAGIGACVDLLTAGPAVKPGLLSKLRKIVGARA
jgi:hypothetical protein